VVSGAKDDVSLAKAIWTYVCKLELFPEGLGHLLVERGLEVVELAAADEGVQVRLVAQVLERLGRVLDCNIKSG
jgi:hypothetical protein